MPWNILLDLVNNVIRLEWNTYSTYSPIWQYLSSHTSAMLTNECYSEMINTNLIIMKKDITCTVIQKQ